MNPITQEITYRGLQFKTVVKKNYFPFGALSFKYYVYIKKKSFFSDWKLVFTGESNSVLDPDSMLYWYVKACERESPDIFEDLLYKCDFKTIN